MAKRNYPEYELQKQVCKYIDLQYPNALYLSDSVAFTKLTIPQQVRNKAIQKQGFKCPDLLILQSNKIFNGLFIELKVKSPFKKSGELKKDDHLEGQQKTIKDLIDRGYYATFSTGFEQTKEIIDDYFKN